MKLIALLFSMSIACWSCNHPTAAPLPNDTAAPVVITGCYVSIVHTENAYSADTMTIAHVPGARPFQLSLRGTYQHTMAGCYLPPQFFRHQWVAILDKASHTLQAIGAGPDVVFTGPAGTCQVGRTVFQRIE